VAWSLLLNSLPAHKEFRFLLPALQLLMPYAGAAVAQLVHALRANMQGCDSKRTAARARSAEEASLSKGHLSGRAVADGLHASEPGAASAEGDDRGAAGKVVCSMLLQLPTAGSSMLPGPVRRPAARSPEGSAAAVAAVTERATAAVARSADLRRQPDRREWRTRQWRLMLAAAAVVLCLGAQLPVAAYFCLVHQRYGMQNFVSCCPACLVLLPSTQLLYIVFPNVVFVPSRFCI